MAAEYACRPSKPSKFSLFPWQAWAAMAAQLRSCSDQRMLMHRMQGRRSRLQFGPTSRARDSVWFLFPWVDFDPTRNFSKLIPRSTSCFQASPLSPALNECFSPSTGSVGGEYYLDALLLRRFGCRRPQPACRRLRPQIPTWNLLLIIARH
jgi:hypothetical protein